MGYGLGSAGAAALNSKDADRRTIAVMGDGGFWHNGLTSGVGNAVFNENDQLLVVVDNDYAAATGGQDLLSSHATKPERSTQHPIEKAARGVGVEYAKTIDDTFDVGDQVKDAFMDALHDRGERPEAPRHAERVPAEPPAPGQTGNAQGAERGQARGARALRRRPRDLHRRSRLHPHQRLPVALDRAEPGPDADRPGGDRAEQLRRLRRLRHQRPHGGTLPELLPHRRGPEPDQKRRIRGQGPQPLDQARLGAASSVAPPSSRPRPPDVERAGPRGKPPAQRRDPRPRRRGRRRARRLDRRHRRGGRLRGADDLGRGRRPAHRRDRLLPGDAGAGARRSTPTTTGRESARPR